MASSRKFDFIPDKKKPPRPPKFLITTNQDNESEILQLDHPASKFEPAKLIKAENSDQFIPAKFTTQTPTPIIYDQPVHRYGLRVDSRNEFKSEFPMTPTRLAGTNSFSSPPSRPMSSSGRGFVSPTPSLAPSPKSTNGFASQFQPSPSSPSTFAKHSFLPSSPTIPRPFIPSSPLSSSSSSTTSISPSGSSPPLPQLIGHRRAPNGTLIGSHPKTFVEASHVPYFAFDKPVGPANPVKNLNEIWSACWDDEAGAVYYYNNRTGEATWLPPVM